MISDAAYYIAERNNFQTDHIRNWIEAEKEIAEKLGEAK